MPAASARGAQSDPVSSLNALTESLLAVMLGTTGYDLRISFAIREGASSPLDQHLVASLYPLIVSLNGLFLTLEKENTKMCSRNWSLSMLVAGLLAAVVIGGVQAKSYEVSAVLVTPKQRAKVDRRTELIGKVLVRGWPVVLVRADQPGSQWWVQESAQGTAPAHFKVNARFGNDKTPAGTPFRVVVLMLQTAEQTKQFMPGVSFQVLPPNLPRSAETVVVLKQRDESKSKDASDAFADTIVSPQPMSKVSRNYPVAGRVAEELWPVVLVRSAEPNSPWWVQGKPVVDDQGEYRAMARFGSDKTPEGSEFRIVVLLVRRGSEQPFAPGMVVKELPRHLKRSAELSVILAGEATVSQSASSADAASGE